MNSLFQLEIPKRSGCCAIQGERFIPGMEIYSLLIENEARILTRSDFCSRCFEREDSLKKNSALKIRGYWKSTIEKPEKIETLSRSDKALILLRNLLKEENSSEEEIFVLCLFLSHARQIALRQEVEKEGILYHLYEIVKREEFFTVKVINLSLIQIETLQKSLADQLQCKVT